METFSGITIHGVEKIYIERIGGDELYVTDRDGRLHEIPVALCELPLIKALEVIQSMIYEIQWSVKQEAHKCLSVTDDDVRAEQLRQLAM